ncbi:MAG: PorV/PorQ family protein [bacterium]
MKTLQGAFVVLILSICSVHAQTIGTYAGEFMAIGVGGRALGLGGAHVALASDVTAGYWNPAALARLHYPEFMLMHDERFGNLINYDYAAAAFPVGNDASFGLSVLRLGVDGIPDTRNALIDNNGNGVFDEVDRLDRDRITFYNVADWAMYLSYAKRESELLMIGASVKLIRRNYGEHSATGIGFDVGVLYSPFSDLSLGASVQDITTTFLAWNTGRNELISPTLKIGAAYGVNLLDGRLMPALDFDLRFENRRYASTASFGPVSVDPRAGLEFDYKNTLALRVGYSDVKQMTIGAGIHLRKIDIDYSFARFTGDGGLGNTHRVSLRFVLQEERFARTPQ